MKKGDILTGTVSEVRFGCKGIVQTEEGKVEVKNVIPGQKLKILVTKKRKLPEGRVLEIIEKAPGEVEIDCGVYGRCGGCVYTSMPPMAELKLKEEQVKRLLSDALFAVDENEELNWTGIKESPVRTEYRNKMEFSFGNATIDGPLLLGMHERGSFYNICDASHCVLVDADFRAILSKSLQFFREKNATFVHRNTHEGYLRHLLIRKGSSTGEILVGLVTSSNCDFGANEELLLDEYKELLLGLKLTGSITGILHIVNDAVSDTVKADRLDVLYGRDYFYEYLCGLKFKVSVFSFFQTNSKSAEVLYTEVLKLLDDKSLAGNLVYDLYCGTGTISMLLAKNAGHVVGVEIVEEAVEAAKKSALENGVNNVSFIAGDVLKVLDELEEKPDTIVLDPPRDGVNPKALAKILDYGVKNIIYVSCKPTSLARDISFFYERGYKLGNAFAVDQFPCTGNVEAIALFSK